MDDRKVLLERLKRDPKYRGARQKFISKFPDYPHGVWTQELTGELDRFVTKWSIAPIDPESKEFDTEPRYYYEQVGKDGAFLIRVYPWTTEQEVLKEYRRIREDHQEKIPERADTEVVKKVVDLVNRGEDFRSIGREIFGDDLDQQGREELEVDQRLDKLVNIFLGEELSEEEAREKALSRVMKEELYLNLNRPYNPGERTRGLEKKAQQIYELLRSGLE